MLILFQGLKENSDRGKEVISNNRDESDTDINTGAEITKDQPQ